MEPIDETADDPLGNNSIFSRSFGAKIPIYDLRNMMALPELVFESDMGEPFEKGDGHVKLRLSDIHFAVDLVAMMSRQILKTWESGLSEDDAKG